MVRTELLVVTTRRADVSTCLDSVCSSGHRAPVRTRCASDPAGPANWPLDRRDDRGVTIAELRVSPPLLTSVVLAAGVGGLVVVSRAVAGAFWGTSSVVLLAAMLGAAALGWTSSTIDPACTTWRRGSVVMAAIVLVNPGLWAAVALADHGMPGSRLTWIFAVAAGTAHLPLLASCSVFPLLAARRLGGTTMRPLTGVVALMAAAMIAFALFFSEFEPFTAEPLVAWPPGEVIGSTLNLLFLATVLVGPTVALRAARRAEGRIAQQLSQVALCALAGVALVMLCGALGASLGLGTVVLFVGLHGAVVTVVIGCTRVITGVDDVARVPEEPGQPEVPEIPLARLSRRESEVLALLADGLSNAGIADRLVVSERTVDAHVRSIFAKLDLPEGPFDNRRVHAVRAWHEARTLN